MSDDVFRLTPLDVRKQEFKKAMRGFETLEVEDFRSRVADEMERLVREKNAFEEKFRGLAEQLAMFRDREKAMNEALVAAQQLREETRASAEREAQVIVREAEAEGRRLLDEAQRAEQRAQERQVEIQRQFAGYLAGFRALLERQLAELRTLEGDTG